MSYQKTEAGDRLREHFINVQDTGTIREREEAFQQLLHHVLFLLVRVVRPFVWGNHLSEALDTAYNNGQDWMAVLAANHAGLSVESAKFRSLMFTAIGAVAEAVHTWDRELGGSPTTTTLHAVRQAVHAEICMTEFLLTKYGFAQRGQMLAARRACQNAGISIDDPADLASPGLPGSEAAVRTMDTRFRRWGSINTLNPGQFDQSFEPVEYQHVESANTTVSKMFEKLYADPVTAFITVRRLGLDGEPPDSFVGVKRALGKTNPETVRQAHLSTLKQLRTKYTNVSGVIEEVAGPATVTITTPNGTKLILDGHVSLKEDVCVPAA